MGSFRNEATPGGMLWEPQEHCGSMGTRQPPREHARELWERRLSGMERRMNKYGWPRGLYMSICG